MNKFEERLMRFEKGEDIDVLKNTFSIKSYFKSLVVTFFGFD